MVNLNKSKLNNLTRTNHISTSTTPIIYEDSDKYYPSTEDKTNLLILDLAKLNRTTLNKIEDYNKKIEIINKFLNLDTTTQDSKNNLQSDKKKYNKIKTKLKEYNEKLLKIINKINNKQNKNTNLGVNSLLNIESDDKDTFNNTFIGRASGNKLKDKFKNNTALGSQSMKDVKIEGFNHNTAIGINALSGENVKKSDSNTVIGNNSGIDMNGNNNIIIGNNSNVSDNGGSNEIVIGNNAKGHGNNKVVLGNQNTTHLFFDKGSYDSEGNKINQTLGVKNEDGDGYFSSIYTNSIQNNDYFKLKLPTTEGSTGQIVVMGSDGNLTFASNKSSKSHFENWNPNNDNKTDLGTSQKKFKNLHLSNGIRIKKKEIIEYPFNGNNSVGTVLNNLMIHSSYGLKVDLDLEKTNNINISANDIINSGGRLFLPTNFNNKTTIVFNQTAAIMNKTLNLKSNGDFIDNIFISTQSAKFFQIANNNGNVVNVKSNNGAQYNFIIGNENPKSIKNDMSIRIKIQRVNLNKLNITFSAF